MKRGDLVKAALSGDYGKPRPCLVVQSDELQLFESMLICPLTSDVNADGPTRVPVPATPETGLLADSLVMVEKITAVSRARCRERIGSVQGDVMNQVEGALLFVLGIGE